MKNLEELLAEISRDEKLAEKFKSLKNTEEFIKFCENLGAKVTEEDINKALIAKIPKSAEMSDEELELVSGGRMDFRKVQSLVLAATTFMGVAGGIAPSTFAAQGQSSQSSHDAISENDKLTPKQKELLQAIKDSDYSKCEDLIKKGAKATDDIVEEAVRYCDNLEIVKLLIKENLGSLKNAIRRSKLRIFDKWCAKCNIYGSIACNHNSNKEIVNFFFDNGFDLDNSFELTLVCQNNTAEILELVLNRSKIKPDVTCMQMAWQYGNVEKLNIILKHKKHVDSYELKYILKNFKQRDYCDLGFFEFLLNLSDKKEIAKISDYGFENACLSNNTELAKLLKNYGARPNVSSLEVNMALQNNNTELLKILLSCCSKKQLAKYHQDINLKYFSLFRQVANELKESKN